MSRRGKPTAAKTELRWSRLRFEVVRWNVKPREESVSSEIERGGGGRRGFWWAEMEVGVRFWWCFGIGGGVKGVWLWRDSIVLCCFLLCFISC